MNQEYWRDKNVLVTGINGFIGGNLTRVLIEKGANVFGLIRNIDKQTFLYFEGLLISYARKFHCLIEYDF